MTLNNMPDHTINHRHFFAIDSSDENEHLRVDACQLPDKTWVVYDLTTDSIVKTGLTKDEAYCLAKETANMYA